MAIRLAILDLGTNSVRFDIHEISNKRAPRLIHREKLMVRLGERLFERGRLDARAMKRTLEALATFKKTADELQVDKWVAFATSALREAKEKLIARLDQEPGVHLKESWGKVPGGEAG